jgi:hypothetical protein
MDELHAADAIFVACHSQGSIVSTHLLDRLIQDKHIRTSRVTDVLSSASAAVTSAGGSVHAPRPPQRVCCLALCGIHLGPLRYLSSSSVLQPYFQVWDNGPRNTTEPDYMIAVFRIGRSEAALRVPGARHFRRTFLVRPGLTPCSPQNTESEVSKNYVDALRRVLDHGVRDSGALFPTRWS